MRYDYEINDVEHVAAIGQRHKRSCLNNARNNIGPRNSLNYIDKAVHCPVGVSSTRHQSWMMYEHFVMNTHGERKIDHLSAFQMNLCYEECLPLFRCATSAWRRTQCELNWWLWWDNKDGFGIVFYELTRTSPLHTSTQRNLNLILILTEECECRARKFLRKCSVQGQRQRRDFHQNDETYANRVKINPDKEPGTDAPNGNVT